MFTSIISIPNNTENIQAELVCELTEIAEKQTAIKWHVRSTYYHAVPSQTNSRFWETASGRNVNGFSLSDTIYLAVPQNMYKELRGYRVCRIEDKPCRIEDKMNRRYNGADIVDVLVGKGQRYENDSITILFY